MSTRIARTRVGNTNVYFLRDRGTIVVDPGGPLREALAARAFRKIVAALGTPAKVDLIVLTHANFDHVGASPGLREMTGAPVAVHRAEADLLKTGRAVWPPGVTRWGKITRAALWPFTKGLALPVFDADVLIDDGGLDLEPYGVTGRIVHTPGHSPGSVSVVLPSGDAIVGDLVMGFPLCLRPQLGIYAFEPELMPASWQRLVDLGVHTIHPAHGHAFPVSALSRARRRRH